MTQRPVPYGGIATRAVALALDMAFAQGIVVAGGAVVALVASLAGDGRFDTLDRILAAVAWALVVGTYFVLFWSAAGQTPGMRIMGLRLMTYGGAPPGVARSAVRLAGLVLAIIPLFLGFVPVLLDARRRALPDYLARTVVVYAETEPAKVVWTTPDGHRTASLPPRPAERTMRPIRRSTGSPP